VITFMDTARPSSIAGPGALISQPASSKADFLDDACIPGIPLIHSQKTGSDYSL